MSITTAEILQRMVSMDGCIVVLRNTTPAYEKHIVVGRADGVVIDNLSCEIFDDLIEANLVGQDHYENETELIFKLTDCGREAAKTPLEKYLKQNLSPLAIRGRKIQRPRASLGWRQEIRAIAPAA